MERLIKNLGCSYDALIANHVIKNLPLQSLYEDGDSLEIEPVPGIELVFWPETERFEVIYITLKDSDLPEYEGELPEPFKEVKSQDDVHRIFGDPAFSKSALELFGTGLSGWDTYQLDPQWHPAALMEFQYVKDMRIGTLLFSLIDRNV
ncbi:MULTISPECIES: DUF6392 family protein [unclassified Pseudomonas]|uniref:DUF6392 family protein n=1 Tax=unclassified Pseudomonas TaxID=196821 RepID=UPI001FFF3A1A|nr:DUF6392 family protein [Pseudomonas sp. MWU12-2020]